MLKLLTLIAATIGSSAMPIMDEEPRLLMPREPAAHFESLAVINDEIQPFSYSANDGKWMVLFFYPFDFTFVCPTEIVAFSNAAAEFASINANVAAVSTDSHHTHLAWSRTAREDGGVGSLSIPLIADVSKRISFDYGVLITDPADDMYGAALRGLFIIDPTGKIRSVTVNDDAAGRSVEEAMRLLKAFQYADAHEGEACPANWKEGDKTIKTNADGSKDFFKTW